MPFLTYLDPASVDPADLVNRDEVVTWLQASLYSFLRAPDKSRGRAVALLGDRGIGKSIVMRKVIDDLREELSGTTLFAVVDCRGVGDARRVYNNIAKQLVEQLGHRKPALLDTARLLETISKFDSVERRVLEANMTHYKGALALKGAFLRELGMSYDLNLSRSRERREALEGVVTFDAARLRDAVVALFDDLRTHAKLDVIVVLDNLDELRHEALVDEKLRTWLHAEIDGLLGLAQAPIGFLVTARTYFAGALNRQIDANKVIRQLDIEDLQAIIQRRLEHEADDTRGAFTSEASQRCITALAGLARTPLALLSWFRYLAENELHEAAEPATALRSLLVDRFANINPKIIDDVVGAYTNDPYTPVSSAELQRLCRDNQALFNQLLRSQIVLPVDFWAPHEFVLAPELHFMCELS